MYGHQLTNSLLSFNIVWIKPKRKAFPLSSWVSFPPLGKRDFYLHQIDYRDAICLRYGWKLDNIPQCCNCGAHFTMDDTMVCHMGGFLTVRHNEIRAITASLPIEVCHNISTEPPSTFLLVKSSLVNLQIETIMIARIFMQEVTGTTHKMHFIDVGVFYPNAFSSNCSTVISST